MSTWLDTRPAQSVSDAVEAIVQAAQTQTDHRAVEAIRYSGGDARFALWLYLIDQRISRRYGLSLWDLEDWMSRDAYDAGMSPAEGAREAMGNDDIGAEMLAEMEG